MSFGKKHLGSVLNKARSNIHNIRHINDTDLKRQFKQDFHYLGLMKTPDKIATNQKAVDYCNRFMFEVFVNLNGLKPVLSVFNSDIIVDQYIKQFDQLDSLGSSIPIINRIFEELLVVLNLVMRQSEKQIDWRVYDTWQTLFRFYKRIGAVNEDVKVLTCILVFKIIDDEELLNGKI